MTLLDTKDTQKCIQMSAIIEEVEKAYLSLKENLVIMPDRAFIPTHDGGDLMLGGSYIKSSGYFGVKLSAFSPNNSDISKVNGTYTLFNEKEGTVAAIMDCEPLTAARTGAKSAVAVKYLARKESSTLGVLGMGRQAKTQIEAINLVVPLKKVLLWSRDVKKHSNLISFIKRSLQIEVEVMSPNEVAESSDILIDTTYTFEPLVGSEHIKNGTLVVGINHSSTAIEFDEATLGRSKVFVDYKQNLKAGTLQNAIKEGTILESEIIELKDIINCDKFRVDKDKLVYFHSGGTSIEDLAAAITVYRSYMSTK